MKMPVRTGCGPHINYSNGVTSFTMSNNRSINMLEGSLWDKLLLFALPLAASSSLQQFFNAADVAVVGNFAGSNSLAAVGANSALINLMINLFTGLSLGSNVVIAHLLGQKKEEAASRAIHTAILVALISGIFLALLGQIVASPVLTLMDTPADILPKAVIYFRIYFLGMPFFMLYNFSASILRAKGDTRRPLYVLAFSGTVNIVLNLFFVIVCKMDVAGVALATLISNGISSMTLIFLLTREEGIFHLDFKKLRIDFSQLMKIAQIGIPTGVQGMMFSFSNVILQSSLNALGASAMAASSASLNFEYLAFFMLNAFTQAGMTFVSQNYGAGNRKRCRRVILTCFVLDELFSVGLCLIFILFKGPFAGIFSSDSEIIALAGVRMTIILGFEFLNVGIDYFSGIMRSVGHALLPALISVGGICGIRLLLIFTWYPTDPGYNHLMYVYPISWVFTLAAMLIAFFLIAVKVLRDPE